jgi:hypothetical protein
MPEFVQGAALVVGVIEAQRAVVLLDRFIVALGAATIQIRIPQCLKQPTTKRQRIPTSRSRRRSANPRLGYATDT